MTAGKGFTLLLSFLLLLTLSIPAESADLVVRGKTLETGTRRPLEGITVYLLDQEADGAVSNRDGNSALNVGAQVEF